jgi:valine--pyruvate aminotransferase
MPSLSKIGLNMNRLSGVRAIMKDIQETLAGNKDRVFYDFSAGNPVVLPEVIEMWKTENQDEFAQVIARYGSSKGYQPFIEALFEDFNQRYGQNFNSKNVTVACGSMTIAFLAANAFAGHTDHGVLKKVLLPVTPDYTGFGGINLDPAMILGQAPIIHKDLENHTFKYHADLENLKIDESIGLIILSRPNNPTGNILDKEEVIKIVSEAAKYEIPVLLDSAYSIPYPALNYKDIEPIFAPNVIHVMSLSKAGLPGERLGVAIGDQKYIDVIEAFATNTSIHSARFGQAIAAKAIKSGQLAKISENTIRPFYQNKSIAIKTALSTHLSDSISWYLHECDGGMFAWLWLENMPISDTELYDKLKNRGVIAVPGSGFFPGIQDSSWKHPRECIRLSLTASEDSIKIGIPILAEVIEEIYS